MNKNLKLESLQLQLDFELIMNDDPKKINKLIKKIRDIKLNYLFEKYNNLNDENN